MKTSKTGPRLKKPGGEGLLRASPFLLPSLIGLAIFYLAPMVVSIFISLTDWNGLDRLFADGFMQEHFIGLDNYKAILTSQEFWKVLKNTLTYIVLYLPLMMAVSLAVASLLSQQRRGVGVFRVLYYIPVLTSWVAASLIWKSILAPQYTCISATFNIVGCKISENTSSVASHSARLPSEYLLNSTIRLFHQMVQIFHENAVPPSNPMGIRVDSKRRKKLIQKRLAMGHKQDDHEQAQGYEQSL